MAALLFEIGKRQGIYWAEAALPAKVDDPFKTSKLQLPGMYNLLTRAEFGSPVALSTQLRMALGPLGILSDAS